MFRCSNGDCVMRRDVCRKGNWRDDYSCKDRSHEDFCGDNCGGMEDRFRCANGDCIEEGRYKGKCDASVASYIITFNYINFIFSIDNLPLNLYSIFFGQNCKDGSDESTTTCGEDCALKNDEGFACKNGKCIEAGYNVCEGWDDCGDNSDEDENHCGDNCGGREDRFRCANGDCINRYDVDHDNMCDGEAVR